MMARVVQTSTNVRDSHAPVIIMLTVIILKADIHVVAVLVTLEVAGFVETSMNA